MASISAAIVTLGRPVAARAENARGLLNTV
jgi:hypothetical protein